MVDSLGEGLEDMSDTESAFIEDCDMQWSPPAPVLEADGVFVEDFPRSLEIGAFDGHHHFTAFSLKSE